MSGGFTFDTNGRLKCSTGTIVSRINGLPFDVTSALVCADGTGAAAYSQNGIPFAATGAVAVDSTNVAAYAVNGIPMTAAGRISMNTAAAITFYQNGLPLALGSLAVSGLAAFSPSDISGLQFWYDPNDAATITHVAGAVSQLSDKSGNLRHLLQATGANQPITGTATSAKGKNALAFSTSDFLQTAGSFTINQPTTIFVVAKANAYTDAATIYTGKTAFSGEQLLRSVSLKWEMYAGLQLAGAANADAVQHIHTNIFAGAASLHYLDGVLDASGDAFTNSMTTGLTMGARTGGGSNWNGWIGEMFGYNKVLNASELNQAGTYLSDKW